MDKKSKIINEDNNKVEDTQLDFYEDFLNTKNTFNQDNKVRTSVSSAPTYTPKTFLKQFQFYNGNLYVYIDGSWTTIGASYATGNFTFSGSTGNQAITGVGFTPKMIKIDTQTTTNDGGRSWGAYTTSEGNFCIYNQYVSSVWENFKTTSYSITATESGGSNQSTGKVISLDSDGFTLDWITANAQCYINWYAFG